MSGESTVMPPRKLHDADVVYLYDGTFEGFLCCVFESFAQHEIPFAVWTPLIKLVVCAAKKCTPRLLRRIKHLFRIF